jgi:hypothetical protein
LVVVGFWIGGWWFLLGMIDRQSSYWSGLKMPFTLGLNCFFELVHDWEGPVRVEMISGVKEN